MKNKDDTKQRIINAIGEIFRTDGYKGLYIAQIARKAGVDRSLIYQYFGKDVTKLIEAYIVQRDYWLKFFNRINEEVKKSDHQSGKDLIIDVLQKQWQYFSTDLEMQHLILWELSGDSDLMRSIRKSTWIKCLTLLVTSIKNCIFLIEQSINSNSRSTLML